MLIFNKEQKVSKMASLYDETTSATNQLMSCFISMIFNNQTLNHFSEIYGTKDFIAYIFDKLTKLYNAEKYLKNVGFIFINNENNINYNCLDFYQNLDNQIFLQLKNKFSGQIEKFYFTMFYFCEATNIMMFKNYKTIYLQLFNQVKILMENFKNNKYGDIIDFIDKYKIVQIEIIYLITYVYLLDIIYQNIQSSTLGIMNIIHSNIVTFGLIYLFLLIFLLIFIYFVFIRNIHNDTKKFIHIRKVFKVCNINE